MIVKVNWDTDGELINDLPEQVEVPEMELDEIADWLSDNYGWCVNSFNVIKQ